MTGYIYLGFTIIFETLAITLMKQSDGVTNKVFLAAGGICYAATFFLLTMTLRYLPMGYTNAVWAGASTLLVYLAGIWYYKEKTSWVEILFLICILTGIIGLNFLQKGK